MGILVAANSHNILFHLYSIDHGYSLDSHFHGNDREGGVALCLTASCLGMKENELMKLPPILEHLHNFLESLFSRFRFFGGGEAESYGIDIGFI